MDTALRSSTIPTATDKAHSPTEAGTLNPPYGGPLVDLIVGDERAAEMKATAKDFASLTLDERGLCDLELLAVGGFSPLKAFLGKADYERVVAEMRLADGTLWPLPVTLPVTPGDGVAEGKPLALRDVYGNLLAFLHVEEIYAYDKEDEAAERLRLDRRQASRGRPPRTASRATTPRAGSRSSASRRTTTSSSSAAPRPSSATTSARWAGPRSSPSRPATPCTGPTRS